VRRSRERRNTMEGRNEEEEVELCANWAGKATLLLFSFVSLLFFSCCCPEGNLARRK
jgi:hypothetical protein